MYLFYVDDSHERHFFTFCAIGIPDENWRKVFNNIRDYRKHLRAEYGIHIWKELHAWKFVSGRGNPSDRVISKALRCKIYNETLQFLAKQAEHGVILISTTSSVEDWAFERMLNRISSTMKSKNQFATLYCDKGNEGGFTKICRRLAVFNPIPSKYGTWSGSGAAAKNIPTERIIEDPVFKESHKSNLIQMADFCAYALLRKEKPHPARTAQGIDKSFALLAPVCLIAANPNDQYGIVRDKQKS